MLCSGQRERVSFFLGSSCSFVRRDNFGPATSLFRCSGDGPAPRRRWPASRSISRPAGNPRASRRRRTVPSTWNFADPLPSRPVSATFPSPCRFSHNVILYFRSCASRVRTTSSRAKRSKRTFPDSFAANVARCDGSPIWLDKSHFFGQRLLGKVRNKRKHGNQFVLPRFIASIPA